MRSPFAGASRKPNHLRDATGFLSAAAEVEYLRQSASSGADTLSNPRSVGGPAVQSPQQVETAVESGRDQN